MCRISIIVIFLDVRQPRSEYTFRSAHARFLEHFVTCLSRDSVPMTSLARRTKEDLPYHFFVHIICFVCLGTWVFLYDFFGLLGNYSKNAKIKTFKTKGNSKLFVPPLGLFLNKYTPSDNIH